MKRAADKGRASRAQHGFPGMWTFWFKRQWPRRPEEGLNSHASSTAMQAVFVHRKGVNVLDSRSGSMATSRQSAQPAAMPCKEAGQ